MAPIELSVVTPMFGFFVTRVSSVAPFATSFPTNASESIVPDPCGAGLLLPAIPAFRTHET